MLWQIPINVTGTRALGRSPADGRELAFAAGPWHELLRVANNLHGFPSQEWAQFSVFLPVTADPFRVRFSTARGYASTSDVALDSVEFLLAASPNSLAAMRRVPLLNATASPTPSPTPVSILPTPVPVAAVQSDEKSAELRLKLLLFKLQTATLALALSAALPMLGAIELSRSVRRRVWARHVQHADFWGVWWHLALATAQLKRTTENEENVRADQEVLLLYKRATARARWLQQQRPSKVAGTGKRIAVSCGTVAKRYAQARVTAASGWVGAWRARLHGVQWRSVLLSTLAWLVASTVLLVILFTIST